LENKMTKLQKIKECILEMKAQSVAKDKQTGLPKKYVARLRPQTKRKRKAHFRRMRKRRDSDPKAYKPAPGDKGAETKPSKHTKAVRALMMREESKLSLSAKAKKTGISLSTLKTIFRRGMAAWKSGHRPGTTPQQWGHARVNSYINKGKTYHTADSDLRK
jgi:hypothetical protein